jgi:two-component system sensor histidine kinase CpxA
MRSLYWKIFISFWLATILIIVTIAWLTSEIAQKSSLSSRERVFMDSYANAAVATYETGGAKALAAWFAKTGLSEQMKLYLLTSEGEVFGHKTVTQEIQQIAQELKKDQLNEGIVKKGNLVVSHEILSPSGVAYRLVAVSPIQLGTFIQIPWAGLSARLLIAIFISGLICYLLSYYLTQPLRSLQQAARAIAKGEFKTRVGRLTGHSQDEIARLSEEFDSMAEQIETLLHSKERLLQDISHELRTPLARLQIAMEIGRKKTNNLAEKEFDRMELECLRLNELIGEILEYARLEKSTNAVKVVATDLRALIQRIVNDANYEHPTIPPTVKIDKLDPCITEIDSRLLHRAIENILRNAIRYTPAQGQVSVTLTCPQDLKQIFIDIKDQGPGVPSEHLENIFSPFYRVDTAREKKTGGFGLGLAIAHQAILLHKGKITAENLPNQGLWVRITLAVEFITDSISD